MSITQTVSEQTESNSESKEGVSYPYPSDLAQQVRVLRDLGVAVEDWRAPGIEIDTLLKSVKGPVLEIGGPTDSGYYFLDGQKLPSRPVVANINHSYYDGEVIEGVEMIIDGRNLPFSEESLGIVLSAHLPRFDVHDESFTKLSRSDQDTFIDTVIARVDGLLHETARKGVIDQEILDVSVRLAIAKEVYGKLTAGGLYMTDADAVEIANYELLGFELVASFDEASLVALNGDDMHYYSIVLRKPEVDQ